MVISMLASYFFEPEDAAVIAKDARKYPKKAVMDVPAGG